DRRIAALHAKYASRLDAAVIRQRQAMLKLVSAPPEVRMPVGNAIKRTNERRHAAAEKLASELGLKDVPAWQRYSASIHESIRETETVLRLSSGTERAKTLATRPDVPGWTGLGRPSAASHFDGG